MNEFLNPNKLILLTLGYCAILWSRLHVGTHTASLSNIGTIFHITLVI